MSGGVLGSQGFVVSSESRDEARWHALLRHASDLAWAARPHDGSLTVVSPATAAALGRDEEDLLRASVFDLVHPDDLAGFRAAWEELRRGQNRRTVLDCRLRHSEGRWLPVRQTLTGFLDDPHVGGIVGNAVRRTGTSPGSDGLRYQARFEQAPVPQAFVDITGHLTEVNQAFCDLLGCDVDAAVGRHALEFQHPDDRAADLAELTERPSLTGLLRGTAESLQVERVLKHEDGRSVPCLVSGSVLRDEHGHPLGIAAFVQDLSPLRDLERRSQQQEDFFLAISQHATDLAVVADAEGRLVYTSPALTSRLGFEPIDVVGESGNHFVHPDDIPHNRAAFVKVITAGGSTTLTLRLRNAAGEWRWYEETMRNLLATPIGGVVCNMRDITERVEAEQSLRASEALYRAIVDNADEGLWVVTPTGRTLYVNHRMSEILGVDAVDLLARPAPEVFGPEGDLLRHKIAHRHEVGPERYEIGYEHPDGGRRTLRFAAAPLPADSEEEGALAMVTDVTDARRLEGELRSAALHDSLTGLPNRALLLDRLEHSLHRDGASVAVLFVDLDQFKMVNDARGHTVGDELLVAVAARLRSAVHSADTVARFGGDEFVVVCEDVNDVRAFALAEALLETLERPVEVTGGQIHVTASIGVALSDTHVDGSPTSGADELLRSADTAMYAAKSAGRRGIRMFDQGLAADVSERYRLAGDLRRAIADDELEMHFQPIIDLHTGAVRGTEALCRWTHPELGQVGPERFVAIADEAGMARDLDRWVLCRALDVAGRMRSTEALPAGAYVAVNLSARSLTDPDLEQYVVDCTRDVDLEPGDVVLEITEGAIMADPEAAADLLGRLRTAGFQVAIDDFGTGHSSLAYLDRFPVTKLKVDRSFVGDLSGHGTSRAIVASVLDLARAIGVGVIAEGVETVDQAEQLRSMGCELAQGWLWSPAVSPAEAETSRALSRTYVAGIPPG